MSGILRKTFSTGNAISKKRIEFYYDVISPYSWFAFEVMMRYKQHWHIDVELKPFFLAGVTKATGNSAPMLVPNKAQYMNQDLQRCVKYFDVPLKMVSDPFDLIMVKGSLIPSRFLTSTSILYPDKLEALTRALWTELWNKDQDISSQEVLAKTCAMVGLEAKQIEKIAINMTEDKTKDKLKENTAQAVEYGAFGSPTIIAHVGGEAKLFFGSDRFPLIAQEIGEVWKGPNPDNLKTSL